MSMQRNPRRRVIAGCAALAALAALLVGPARAATTDTVLDWNLHATNALINAPTATPPGAGMAGPVSALHLAMVQAAVFDAVNAIDGGYEPYLEELPDVSPDASMDAAASTAAHEVLVGLTNPQTGALLLPADTIAWLDAAYEASLTEIPPGSSRVEGIDIGLAAADAMLESRENDRRYQPGVSFVSGTDPGEWRPTSGVSDPFAWVMQVRPFVVPSASQFRTEGPNALTSAAYAEEFNEVKELGSATSATRTPEQTAVALFYTANPFELWNRTFRTIAVNRALTPVEQARLFALLNVAGADAAIACWDDKAYWSFWRPITAIRLAGQDGNPATSPDTNWTPLVTTPPYPDHPSGYVCNTGSVMRVAREFFGTNQMSFSVLNTASNQTREYDRFTDVVKDTIDARVYLGIHFRAADVQAAGLGKRVAHWVGTHAFGRVG